MSQTLTRNAPEGVTSIIIAPTGTIIRIVKRGEVKHEEPPTISERIQEQEQTPRNTRIINDLLNTPDGELKVELFKVFSRLRRAEKKRKDLKKIDRLTTIQGILHSQVDIDGFNAVLHRYNVDTSAFDVIAEFKTEPGNFTEASFNNIIERLRSEPDGENKALLFRLVLTIRGADIKYRSVARKTNTTSIIPKLSRNKILRNSLMKRVNIPELVEFLRTNNIREKALRDFGLID